MKNGVGLPMQGPFGCGDKLLMERGSKFVLDRNGLFIFGEVG